MSPRNLRHRHARRSRLPADRALLFSAPAAVPAPTRHRLRQRSVHRSEWTPSPTSAFMIDIEARSAGAGRPDAHTRAALQGGAGINGGVEQATLTASEAMELRVAGG